MKTSIYLVILALLFAGASQSYALDIRVDILGEHCTGDGFSCIRITINSADKTVTQANASVTGNTITFTMQNYATSQGKTYNPGKSVKITDNISLPEDLALKLGYKSIRILPGTYTVNTSTSKLGTISMRCIAVKKQGVPQNSGTK